VTAAGHWAVVTWTETLGAQGTYHSTQAEAAAAAPKDAPSMIVDLGRYTTNGDDEDD
jgi:hypothetical protein